MAANVQSMCQYWKNFDLQELQRELDTTATELANRQDESEGSRKRLVEQSRDFKKNTPEDIRKIVAPLLKSFQVEIDSLSKRSKAAEASFLSVYKKLIDIPDPSPALEHAQTLQKRAQKVQDLEIENKQLRETLDEYNHEFAEVKNQGEERERERERDRDRQRQTDRQTETPMERWIVSIDIENDLDREGKRRARDEEQTKRTPKKSDLNLFEKQASQLALESAQSELFEVKAKYDEATSAKSDEMEMVMADLERANERAAQAERHTEKLRQQLAVAGGALSLDAGGTGTDGAPSSAPGGDSSTSATEQAMDILKRSTMEVELAAKEKEIAQLVEDVQRLQASLSKLRESTAAQVSRLEEELSSKNQAFRRLEEKLQTQEDYEEVKRELRVLKSIEFSSSETATSAGSEDSVGKSLEVLLLEKNKALQGENTHLKVLNTSLAGSTNHKLASPDVPASPNAPPPPQSPLTTSGLSLDPRHFAPPISPFYAFPGSPFHPAFLPLNMVKAEAAGLVPGLSGLPTGPGTGSSSSSARETTSSTGSSSAPSTPGGLDTAAVARTVRELLSINNIGQRLFAKHVLGLSQGTVSELLSKPKSWDKLTEKGRESYRKMHAWATDDANIMALKAISPKKDAAGNIAASAMYAQELGRINSSSNNTNTKTDSNSNRSVIDDSSDNNNVPKSCSSSPLSNLSSSSPLAPSSRNNHSHHKLHQEHLQPKQPLQSNLLLPQHEATSPASIAFPKSEDPGSPDTAPLALDYRINSSSRPLNGLCLKTEPMDSGANDNNNLSDLTNNYGAIDLSKPSSHTASSSPRSSPATSDSGAHTGSAFFQVNPRLNGHTSSSSTATPLVGSNISNKANNLKSSGGNARVLGESTNSASNPVTPLAAQGQPQGNSATPGTGGVAGGPRYGSVPPSECLSPLQRMQNIANSLNSRGGGSGGPPGSASTPPGGPGSKPLRAVLPPITQEEFDRYANMNTDELVKKVKETLSQYSISQRLFGESVLGLSQGSVSDLLARPKPWHMLTQKGREPFIRMQLFLEDTESIPKLHHQHQRFPNLHPGLQGLTPPGGIPPLPEHFSSAILPPTTDLRLWGTAPNASSASSPPLPPLPPSSLSSSSSSSGLPPTAPLTFPSSMLEVIAMTSEIDTLTLTSRVKDVLQFHNLGQKLFGEAVLGLSQGSVSELLSKPKPWHMLSIKGREPFIKMHLWLADPQNVEHLKLYQTQMKGREMIALMEQHSNSASASDPQRNGGAVAGFDSPSTPSQPKRPRVFFTEEQKESLRRAYAQDPYPNQGTIEALARSLGVGVKTVINWFHNHRMRAKQQ
ncbi:hypothetical protein EGW08_013046, partial [Elysia chlorotica]